MLCNTCKCNKVCRHNIFFYESVNLKKLNVKVVILKLLWVSLFDVIFY